MTRDPLDPAGASTVAVIGGGFSGLLTAIHLLRNDSRPTVRLVERGSRFGLGRAYATDNPGHLLNVRVANMSAFPDRPGHFADWLAETGADAGDSAFVSRRRYGDYLQGLLRDHIGDPDNAGRLLLEHDEATDLIPCAQGFEVRLALGRSFHARAVVLAVGAPPPAPLHGVSTDALRSSAYAADPWSLDADAMPAGEVLLIGTGLTMVDVALSLARHDRRLTAVSRHGQLPRSHAPTEASAPPAGPTGSPLGALRTLRTHAAGVGWREAVDSLRPQAAAVWAAWSLDQRRQFLRHAQTLWDVHRHRMAPRVATQIADLIAHGRLEVLGGRITAVTRACDGLEVRHRRRGAATEEVRRVAAVVDCSGFRPRWDAAADGLLPRLIARGLIRQDPLELGLDALADRQLVGHDGRPTPGLYAVGPLTRNVSWEAIAVPDLRNQTAGVARAALTALCRHGLAAP